ncbi:SMC-Scp complex subunit ScpB [Tuberibacillus calidus]|jgi:segregation and condensation protein B|uniref:SMC-Scp complex subunit ScpB n=1 Tax=Tuberibacillus calidus TaxID=340097 RepID=UPI0003F53E81|nr:SMC-Scp complex subunit ScpB [Tuberibacillus calidus]
MKNEQAIVEALLYVSGEDGVTLEQLTEVLNMPEEHVLGVIENLKKALQNEARGLMITEVAGRYQLVTKKEMATYIERLIKAPRPATLSQAALETLAVIAYKQPVSRAEIEEVRGVKSEKALSTLMSKGLIKEVGRAEGTGRAILYGVTEAFLTHFGLKSLNELPEFSDRLDESSMEETDLFYEKFQQTVLEL